jgi:hypothetical protein
MKYISGILLLLFFQSACSGHGRADKLRQHVGAKQVESESALCGSSVFSVPGMRERALERTRKLSPDIYQRTTAAAKSTKPTGKSEQDYVGQRRSFYVYNFESQKYDQVSAILLERLKAKTAANASYP